MVMLRFALYLCDPIDYAAKDLQGRVYQRVPQSLFLQLLRADGFFKAFFFQEGRWGLAPLVRQGSETDDRFPAEKELCQSLQLCKGVGIL